MNLEEKVFDGNDILKNTMFENITRAFGEMRDDREISKYIRERMEEKDPGKWNVIVGKDYATHVSHLANSYGYFKLGEYSVIVWKSG